MDEEEIIRRMELIQDNTELLDILSRGDTVCQWTWDRLMEMTCKIEITKDKGD
jgi:hypothetical protein